MVVGSGMSLMGMMGLRSLEFHSGFSWSPVIHDDGTLTRRDADEWHRLFPDASVVAKADADREMDDALADLPACRENRRRHHWFRKVFDTERYAKHAHYIVLDSDIVFFRRPDLLLDWVFRRPDTLWAMEDSREKYSGPRPSIEQSMGFLLRKKVNSGLNLVPKKRFSFSLAEEFLRKCAHEAQYYQFLEQTIFAVMLSAAPDGRLLPDSYEISWSNFRRPGAICRHYVGPAKFDNFFIEGATTFWWQSRHL